MTDQFANFDCPAGLDVAVIGLAGRFPGAPDVDSLWRNLLAGHEAITEFGEIGGAAPEPGGLGHHVPAAYLLEDIERFDAAFFAMSPREAEITDPQHRVMLEVGFEALENAGYAAASHDLDVGVYVGCGPNSYLINNVLADRRRARAINPMQLLIASEKDYLASRISYKLDLRGPSIVVQSACSTSLLAVHVAARAVAGGECDLALAGGVSFECPQGEGYRFEPGGILSPDGRCRPFSENSAGTVRGNGAALVVLKRLEEALADRDTVYAVIRGSATNNDGSGKVGYAAPSVEGQARVIRAAHAVAEVTPGTIGYVEAHGTATALGDPIEIAALAEAFESPDAPQSCPIGSIKSNIGHLDAAAGVAGMIKATLALYHERVPATLHYSKPNPAIDFDSAGFKVAGSAIDWRRCAAPRRAGVSSFGIGGSNVHLVLEEAPLALRAARKADGPAILRLSAANGDALRESASRLAAHLRETQGVDLDDVAFTLKAGRRAFPERLAVAAADADEAARLLEGLRAGEVQRGKAGSTPPAAALMFPGQGTQFPGMGAGLFGREPVFTAEIERCADILRPLGIDLIDALRYGAAPDEAAAERLSETWLTQPALFAVEYALARQWMAWGVRPEAMIGHSIGEYVAACLAGVFSLEDALRLVCARGRLMYDLPPGSMLAISADEATVAKWLGDEVGLAAVNRSALCVVSGPTENVRRLQSKLEEAGIQCEPLKTSHAFHSSMVDACLARFTQIVAEARLAPPQIPFLSNLTGTWITDAEATSPDYWAAHLRGTVRFADGLRTLTGEGSWALIECGPGRSLSAAARDLTRGRGDVSAVEALPAQNAGTDDRLHAARMRGQLWCNGLDLGPEDEFAGAGRVPLPTYPFQRKRYWIEPAVQEELADGAEAVELSGDDDGEAAAEAAADRSAQSLPERLTRLWGEALGVDGIGADDDFFALGGDSILGMQIAHQARSEGLAVAPRMILEHPTIARLAEALAAQEASGGAGDLAAAAEEAAEAERELAQALVPAPEDACEPFPLTDIQHAYWIGRSGLIGSGNVAAHAYEEFECESLDVERLQAALRGVIARHPMLRGVITEDGFQRVLEQVPDYNIATFDLRALEPEAAERQLGEIRDRKSHQILPSNAWPLFDVSVTLLPGTRARLHVSFDLLITDAWSIMLFWRELEQRYLDPSFDPPALPVTYRDYVLAEERLQSGVAFERARNYWLNRLPDFPGPPSLPLARDPDTVPVPHFVRRTGRFEADAWSRLKAAGGRHGLTPSVLLCATYVEVLAARSETPRFCLNLPAFNRLPIHPEIGEVMGDFTSVLLFEADTRTDEPFAERAHKMQGRLWDDLAALQFSGVKLLRHLAEQRSTVPAMPYVFTSLIFPGGSDAPAGGQIGRLVEGISQTPQVWLDCQVWEEDGALLFNWDSVEALFDPAMLDQMFADFQQLLANLADTEESWTGTGWRDRRAAGFITDAQRAANDTGCEIAQTLLHAPFLEQAAARPEAPAVTGAARLSYGELERASAAIAHDLREAGVEPGARVAIVAEKGWEQVAAALAIVRSGCIYVPIDPDLPRERQHALLGLAEAAAAVTVSELDERLDWPAGLPRILVDEASASREVAWSDPEVDPDSVAYIIFTSGTTGVPKGVVITHRAASNTIEDINRRFEVTADDRVLALSALSFDLSVYDIFGLLAVGGAIVIPQAGSARDPADWLALVNDEGVTLWNTVPALMDLLASHVELSGDPPPRSLRLVMMSGDWIPTNLPDRIRSMAPDAALFSLGGATEASIWSIFHPIGEVDPSWRSIPYGKALANQSFHVLDTHLRPRPEGVPGELYIGGVGLAAGYLDPVETAARFIDHPVTGERLYRTGDLGRWLPDGSIEFLGRADTQVKINGFRIEIGEIEKVACAHPAVNACATIVAGGDQRARRLVCYVSPRPGTRMDTDMLRAYMAERLPTYMVPAQFVEVDALPLTANGKVDRGRLPSADSAETQRPRLGATSATEVRLTEIWRSILKVESIGVTDDFFSLGGDSRQATELVIRIRAEWSPDFPLRAAFERPTIRGLAAILDEMPASAGSGPLGPVARAKPGEPAPLASAQMRLWFHDLMDQGSSTYNIVEPFRFTGALDAEAMIEALALFVARHDALRSTFSETRDGPMQTVAEDMPTDLLLVDLTGLGAEAAERKVAEEIHAATLASFDLATGPLFRARLLRVAPEEHVLVVAVHHIVWDGWSTGIMIGEVSALYRGLVEGHAPELPEPKLRFADVAIWEQEQLESGAWRPELDYWLRQLAEPLPTLALPTDQPRPAPDMPAGVRQDFFIEPETARRFRELCRERGATQFVGYLAAWQMLLHWWCRQDDVVVGVPSGYRAHEQLADIIGFLVNSLAIRIRFEGDSVFSDYLLQVRDTAVEAYANQNVPFDRVVEEVRPRRRASESAPVFRSWFVLHDVPMPPWELNGVSATLLDAHFLLTVHDIKMSLVEKDGGMEGGIDYRTALFEPKTIETLCRCFVALVEQIAAAPDARLSELGALLDRLRGQLTQPAQPLPAAKANWDFDKFRRSPIRSQHHGV